MNYVSQENLDNIIRGLSNKISMSVSNGALIGDTTPVGTVISFMGTQAPLYYLICDGTTYNIAEYQELADFIEAQFGTVNFFGGNGTTTFAVPDLRGEFLRGTGINSHTNQGNGASVGEHQDGTEHLNFYSLSGSLGIRTDIPSVLNIVTTYDSATPSNSVKYVATNTNDTGDSSGTSTTFTSRPTNTSVLYCIKYTKAVIPSEYEDGTPVGRVVFDSVLREGYIKANGAQIEDATIAIPRLLSFVQKYGNQLIAHNQETYDSNVGLYMYDSNADILTLPNYIGRFMEGGNSVTSIEAGLPNIKGEYSLSASTGIVYPNAFFTGPFSVGSRTYNTLSSGYSESCKSLAFNANKANSIYSDSVTTVQPSSIALIPQIRY